jgi:hypothetical protein
VRERKNLNQENGRGRRRVREREILKIIIWRGRGTVRCEGELFFLNKKMREGEEEWERGRARGRERESEREREGEREGERGRAWGSERENMKTQNKKKVDEGEG